MMTVTWEPHWEGKLLGRNKGSNFGKATGAAPTAQEKGHGRRGTGEGAQEKEASGSDCDYIIIIISLGRVWGSETGTR